MLLESGELTPILTSLIIAARNTPCGKSSLISLSIRLDSTSSRFHRWFDHKYGTVSPGT